jgi:hypothetical protein
MNVEAFKPEQGYVLCLKSLPPSLKAHGGFKWPESGHIAAPDWKPTKECGNGLHAFLWGCGDSSVAYIKGSDAKWLVLRVKEKDIVDLYSKVKFPECEVVFCGERDIAVSIVMHHAPTGTAVMFANITGGDGETVTGGDYATVTGGDYATVTGGKYATVTVGDHANATGGDHANATGGDHATVTVGKYATVTGRLGARVTGGDYATVAGGKYANVTGGDHANATGGDYATVTVGDHANATGGDHATVTGGYRSTVTGGHRSIVTGGKYANVTGGIGARVSGGYGATLMLEYSDESKNKKKAVGVDGKVIIPGVKYRLNDAHEFVRAD